MKEISVSESTTLASPKKPQGWFGRTLDLIKEQTTTAPVECPRGWGQVSFVASVWSIPPLFGISRSCPIGGVEACNSCTYSPQTDVVRLSEELLELQRLHADNKLSNDEYEVHRNAVVYQHVEPPGRLPVAAWILGPSGVGLSIVGTALALTLHPGFWVLAIGGYVATGLGISFWGISRIPRRAEDSRLPATSGDW
jgi:hypothetical protein